MVRYSFEPHDTGLGFSTNVVDIGIFDPSGRGLGDTAGFRGWSGGARRHFRITRHWATPGYLAGPLAPGSGTSVPVGEAFVRAEVRRPDVAVDPSGDLTAYPIVALTNPVFCTT